MSFFRFDDIYLHFIVIKSLQYFKNKAINPELLYF